MSVAVIIAGIGEKHLEQFHYSQAVRIGDTLDCSGQGGWDPETGEISDDLATEIEQAFKNVDICLKVLLLSLSPEDPLPSFPSVVSKRALCSKCGERTHHRQKRTISKGRVRCVEEVVFCKARLEACFTQCFIPKLSFETLHPFMVQDAGGKGWSQVRCPLCENDVLIIKRKIHASML